MTPGPAGGFASTGIRAHPGHPDQKSHGRKGGGGDFAERFDAAWTGRDAIYGVDIMMDRPPGLLESERIGEFSGSQVYASFQAYKREGPEGFEGINDALRQSGGDRSALDETLGAHVDRMDAAFDSSQAGSDLAVFRGIDDPSLMFGPAYSETADLTGMEWTDHGYMSTTADRRMTSTFTLDGGAQVSILVPGGHPAVTLSGPDKESEILLPRGTTFRVVGDGGMTVNDQNERVRVLEVEVVPR